MLKRTAAIRLQHSPRKMHAATIITQVSKFLEEAKLGLPPILAALLDSLAISLTTRQPSRLATTDHLPQLTGLSRYHHSSSVETATAPFEDSHPPLIFPNLTS